MNKKPTGIIAIILLLAVSSVASMAVVSAESLSETEQKVPRYSESCAHAHNGYDCKEPTFRTDISDLQKRVSELERHH